MQRRLRIWSATFVGVGAVCAFTGWHRDSAPWLLITGLILAVAALLMDRSQRY